MSTYKLIYFNARGRCELLRWIFVVADQKYEDVRVEREKWKELVPDTPFGQLPILQVDGITLCQGNTIARFLAKRFKLAGKNDLEEALVNMIVDCVDDLLLDAIVKILFGSDESKAAGKKAWEDGKKDEFLTKFEKLLSSNKGDYFVGSGFTLADLAVVNALDLVKKLDEVKYPKLSALQSKVMSNPALINWIKNRPVTSY